MYQIKSVDLASDDEGVVVGTVRGLSAARFIIKRLSAERRSKRRTDGSYPMPVYGIVKESA